MERATIIKQVDKLIKEYLQSIPPIDKKPKKKTTDAMKELEALIDSKTNLKDIVECIAAFYEKYLYYHPHKFRILFAVIDKKSLPIIVTTKAFSSYESNKRKWRVSYTPLGIQYCAKGVSGYNTVFIVPIEDAKEDTELYHLFRRIVKNGKYSKEIKSFM